MVESNKAADAKANEVSNMAVESTAEAAEVNQNVAQIGTDIAQSVTEISQQAVQSTLHMAVQVAERSVDRFKRAFGFSGREAQEAVEQSSRNMQAVAACSSVLTQGVHDISREWLDWAQKRVQRQLEGLDAVLRSRTPHELIAAQSDLVRGNLELLLDTARRIAERSVQAAAEAAGKITAQAEDTAARARRIVDQAQRAA
jgi:hypothetical protein